MKASILLADDHPLFREGIASLINAQDDMEVIAQVGDGLEALRMVRDLQPDMVLMDISMPICNGLEATRLIREYSPELAILILTVHEDEANLFDAIRGGARGYLLKSIPTADFLTAIRGALKGEAYLPPRMAAYLLREFGRLSGNPTEKTELFQLSILTDRELEVLKLIATGAANKEIAAQISVSIHTVKSHVCNILAKLQAENRRHAAEIALTRGWVDPPS